MVSFILKIYKIKNMNNEDIVEGKRVVINSWYHGHHIDNIQYPLRGAIGHRLGNEVTIVLDTAIRNRGGNTYFTTGWTFRPEELEEELIETPILNQQPQLPVVEYEVLEVVRPRSRTIRYRGTPRVRPLRYIKDDDGVFCTPETVGLERRIRLQAGLEMSLRCTKTVVANREGNIFKIGDVVHIHGRAGTMQTITGFRMNVQNTEICAVTNVWSNNGVRINILEHHIEVEVEPVIEESLLERLTRLFPIGTEFNSIYHTPCRVTGEVRIGHPFSTVVCVRVDDIIGGGTATIHDSRNGRIAVVTRVVEPVETNLEYAIRTYPIGSEFITFTGLTARVLASPRLQDNGNIIILSEAGGIIGSRNLYSSRQNEWRQLVGAVVEETPLERAIREYPVGTEFDGLYVGVHRVIDGHRENFGDIIVSAENIRTGHITNRILYQASSQRWMTKVEPVLQGQ
jgi:hypothetical protein